MAGHSKFKNIMHRKGAQDARRAKQFTKVGREITVAAKLGGPDPEANPRLRSAIIAARGVNMPNERIKRAIESAVGTEDEADYTEIRYEGYGPGGIAVIVDALTDNRNRTAAEVRAAFSKYDGNLGETNSVSFMFDRVGEIIFPATVASADVLFEAAVEAGATNAESDDEMHEVICEPDDFSAVRDSLTDKFGEPEKASLTWKYNVPGQVDEETAAKVLKLVDALEDNDDVQSVVTNLELDDEMAERLMAS
ncbi:MAG: YebC/PmpR family DNA-binding transcriptional regulator [Alphaproteobacteria bacterium]|nr:YebC/PmpR family DNA-binding transcriptional regulator [Alphaproteobacteria bacterium]